MHDQLLLFVVVVVRFGIWRMSAPTGSSIMNNNGARAKNFSSPSLTFPPLLVCYLCMCVCVAVSCSVLHAVLSQQQQQQQQQWRCKNFGNIFATHYVACQAFYRAYFSIFARGVATAKGACPLLLLGSDTATAYGNMLAWQQELKKKKNSKQQQQEKRSIVQSPFSANAARSCGGAAGHIFLGRPQR